MNWNIGDRVKIMKRYPGGEDCQTNSGIIERITKTQIILKDGSRYRMNGVIVGAKPEMGTGTFFAPRIVRG